MALMLNITKEETQNRLKERIWARSTPWRGRRTQYVKVVSAFVDSVVVSQKIAAGRTKGKQTHLMTSVQLQNTRGILSDTNGCLLTNHSPLNLLEAIQCVSRWRPERLSTHKYIRGYHQCAQSSLI